MTTKMRNTEGGADVRGDWGAELDARGVCRVRGNAGEVSDWHLASEV